MAINIKFDSVGNPEPPTIVLAKRNGDKLGQLKVDPNTIELNDKFNDASEISFTLYKYIDGKLTNLWDDVVDFKLIYCKEWNMWFEIKVELDEETETIKTVFCTQLGQAELSQLMLYDIHINEEGDSNWNTENQTYKNTILFNPDDTSASLLHRLLKDKAPHYSIIHVDDTIKNIQRTFSFDGTSIYDAFMEIAEEIGCLFVFHSNSDEDEKIQRTISVYDLQQNCLNPDCKHRGEFIDVCPKCGSTNIDYNENIFKDTTIFVTSDELAAGGIQLTTDTDAVKNCFKLEAGDDLMTATIRNCNPNGTDYIWYFSDDMKADMSEELVEALGDYDDLYKYYYNDHKVDCVKKTICENESKTLTFGTDYNIGDTLVFVYLGDGNTEGSITFNYGMSMSMQLLNDVTPFYEFVVDNDYTTLSVDGNIGVYIFDDFGLNVFRYNTLVEKYKDRYNAKSVHCLGCGHKGNFENVCPECGSNNLLVGDKLEPIETPIVGYPALMNTYYDVIDLGLYLKSSLMPNVDISEKSICSNCGHEGDLEGVCPECGSNNILSGAKYQAALLKKEMVSAVAVNVKESNSISETTADSAVLSMAKIIVRSTYKVEINTSTYSNNEWKGNFKITNYSDDEDTVISDTISVTVNNDTETFIKQKIEKALNKEDTEDVSISGLFAKEFIVDENGYHFHTILDESGKFECDFCNELKNYALTPLKSIYDACEECLTILQNQGAGDEKAKPDLYKNLYVSYYLKSQAIAEEIKIREDEVNSICGVWDETDKDNKVLVTKGLQQYIEDFKNEIQETLNFQKYLESKNKEINLWLEFCTYRREDKYSNDNYISDGLNNAELFKKASEFVEVAENEIYKSAELQHSISTSLKNLLAIEKFELLIEHFNVGNWIRVQIDEEVYKLRLLEYNISFGSFDEISVEFSDVIKIKNGITDIQGVLAQASSMATSYSSVQKQASQGEESKAVINNWFNSGLDATNIKIVGNAANQNQVWNENGILCREYDSVLDSYSPEQLKIINSTIAITDNNWESTKTAIGKYHYTDPITGELKMAYGVNGETIVGKLLIGEDLILSNDNNNLTFDNNGLIVSGKDKSMVQIQPSEEESIFNIKNNNGDYVLYLDNDSGNLIIKGDFVSTKLEFEDENGVVSNLSNVAISGSYNDLTDKPTKLSDFENDRVFITQDVNYLTNYYNKTETSSLLDLKVNTSDLASVATTGSYTDLVDIEELKNWVNEQIQNAIG